MVIIYILAVIGGLCVISVFGLFAFLAISEYAESRRKRDETEETLMCAITDEECLYTVGRQTCCGCPIAAEKDRKEAEIHEHSNIDR